MGDILCRWGITLNSILGGLMDFISDVSDGLKLSKFGRCSWFNIIENILVKPKVYRLLEE